MPTVGHTDLCCALDGYAMYEALMLYVDVGVT